MKIRNPERARRRFRFGFNPILFHNETDSDESVTDNANPLYTVFV